MIYLQLIKGMRKLLKKLGDVAWFGSHEINISSQYVASRPLMVK
jgi:hypothetical protein